MPEEQMFEVPGDRLRELSSNIEALRDENDSLRDECQELRLAFAAAKEEHDNFIEEVGALLPPSYDGDEAMEAIILGFLRDMQKLGQIIAKLTADYR